MPLTALAVVLGVLLWAVPQSVVRDDGVRLVLRRQFVAWVDVEEFLDPRPGDEEVRVRLAGGRALTLPGIPPTAVPELRDRWARRP